MKFVAKRLGAAANASSGRESHSETLKNVAGVALTLAALYFVIGFVANAAAMRISEETEAKYFGAAYQSIHSEPVHADFERVRELFSTLSQDEQLRPLPWQLLYSGDKAPNAFAVPGGGVIVTQGLLDAVKSEPALAFVLGHELAHHQFRHTLKGFGRKLLVALSLGVVFGATDSGLVTGAVELAEFKHSRTDERQADELGFRLAHSMFGDSDGYLEFFLQLQEHDGKGDSPWMNFTGSHPPTGERLAHLRSLQKELSSKQDKPPN